MEEQREEGRDGEEEEEDDEGRDEELRYTYLLIDDYGEHY